MMTTMAMTHPPRRRRRRSRGRLVGARLEPPGGWEAAHEDDQDDRGAVTNESTAPRFWSTGNTLHNSNIYIDRFLSLLTCTRRPPPWSGSAVLPGLSELKKYRNLTYRLVQ
jgi:hypothetical protein